MTQFFLNNLVFPLMITRILLAAGSLIFLILGGMHLAFTFFSDKFSPKNPQLEKSMKASSPLITRQKLSGMPKKLAILIIKQPKAHFQNIWLNPKHLSKMFRSYFMT